MRQVLADCTSNGIWAYPSTSELNQNSIIVVEGYARSQRIIDSLNIGYHIYLETEGEKIDLEVIETCKGMFFITQALLKPKSKLMLGKTYELKISNLDEREKRRLIKWNSAKNEYEPISWKVIDKIENENPICITQPKLVDKTIVWYGCGPDVYAVFDLGISDSSNALIRTELYDIKTKEANTYYLTLEEDGLLRVGHGMCSGAFDFNEKGQYKIRFSITDVSGDFNKKWTDWITFDSPYQDYK
jgi:hypothetical protein